MAHKRDIKSPEDVVRLNAFLADMPMPYRVTVSNDPDRTKEQNALLHKWFGEVARQRGDVHMMDVKAQSNFTYGKPILTRDDPTYAAFFGAVHLTHEQTIKAYKLGYIACTSLMKVGQLREYMDAFSTDMRAEGFTLSDPKDLYR